ncbi:hypothetical protein LLG96_15045 [bacterium]|nr:hypothetical protein [bacterium]
MSKSLRTENETLTTDAHALTEKLARSNAIIEDLTKSFPGLSPETVDEFRRRGLSDPQNDIIADLGSHEELMPFRGIFGARPSFYPDVRMYVLNSRWAYASFNDGSRLGQTLLEYTVSERGVITWRVIDKAVFESR